jgi:peptide/nickel transport system permease protein
MAASAEVVAGGEVAPPALMTQQRSLWSRIWRFTRRRPLGAFSGAVCLLILVVALGAYTKVLIIHDPITTHGADRLLPFWSTSVDGERFYPLGTDNLGRDMFSRLVEGAKISVFFGLGVTLISVLIGGTIGLVSSYIGGTADLVVQRVVDALQTVPLLVLAIAVVSIAGTGIMKGFWVLAILSIPRPVRVIRGSVLAVREETYIEAARSLGASDRRVMLRHVLPNVMAPMIVLSSYVLAVAIIIEAALSFLGVGAAPPTPSWGAMLSGNGQAFFSTDPRLALMPGLAISVVVFATNMFGDALRDELDPRLRGSD